MPVTQSGSHPPCETSGGNCGENELAKGEIMRCPMTTGDATLRRGGIRVMGDECIEEDCAWWDSGDECCMIFEVGAKLCSIAMGVALILEVLEKGGELREARDYDKGR